MYDSKEINYQYRGCVLVGKFGAKLECLALHVTLSMIMRDDIQNKGLRIEQMFSRRQWGHSIEKRIVGRSTWATDGKVEKMRDIIP